MTTTPLSSSFLKREIIRLYNEINRDMYTVGVRQQRVEFLGDKIVIMAEHQRIPALASLDQNYRLLTRMVDAALVDEYKLRLKGKIEDLVGIPVRTILKDYVRPPNWPAPSSVWKQYCRSDELRLFMCQTE